MEQRWTIRPQGSETLFFSKRRKRSPPRLMIGSGNSTEVAINFEYDLPSALARIPPNERKLPRKDASALAYWDFGYDIHPHSSHYATTGLRWSHSPAATERFGTAIVDFLAAESGFGFHAPPKGEMSWSRIIFDLLQVTATSCANRKNLKVRERRRGAGHVYRRLFDAIGRTAESPFVVRNSLAGILKLYGHDLANLAAEIERQPKNSFDELFAKLGGDVPAGGDEGVVPPLGNDMEYDGDGNGGAGNIILIEFRRRGMSKERCL